MNAIKKIIERKKLSTRQVSKMLGRDFSHATVWYVMNDLVKVTPSFLLSFHKSFPKDFTAFDCRSAMIRTVTDSKEFKELI